MDAEKKSNLLKKFYVYARVCNVWPVENDSNLSFYRRLVILHIVLLYVDFGLVMYFVETAGDERALFSELVDSIFTIQCAINLKFNFGCMTYLHNTANELFDELQNFDEYGEPETLAESVRTVNYINTGLFMYCALGALSVSSVNIIWKGGCFANNLETGRDVLCGFAVYMKYPYDISTTPLFELHLFMSSAYIMYVCAAGVLFACGSCSAVEFIIVRLNHLKSILGKLSLENGDLARRRYFHNCIKYHQYIIGLNEKTNKCFSIILAPALFQYSVNIGMSLFAFLLDNNFKGLINFFGWICAASTICFIADRLIQKSLSVAFEAYSTNWYGFDTELKRDIMFMVQRAQQPLTLNTGPFGFLSLPGLKQILTGAYTYITMRNVAMD